MLPNGWKKVKLRDVVKMSSGGTPSKDNASFWNGDIPWISALEMHKNYVEDAKLNITEEALKKGSSLAKMNDLLLLTRGSMLWKRIPVCLCLRDVAFNQDVKCLHTNEGLNSTFLLYWFGCMEPKIMHMVVGTGIGAGKLESSGILDLDVDLPPLEEQKKMAATLSVWDSAIEKMEKLIEVKIVQKNSLTYKLIENQNDVKFKLGDVTIDKSKWKKKSLKEMGSFSKGQGIKRDDALSGNIAAVRYGEIYTTHNDYIKEFHSFISEDVAKKSKLLKKGDLLFSCSGETKEDIGKCVAFVSDIVAYAGGDIIIFSPQIECDSKYLGFLLNSPSISKQKYGLGQGDSIVHISAESIGRLTVFLPSYPEQKVIADVLSAIDDELTLLKQQLENYKKQKHGLMQKLLTGQWRVK